MIGRRMGPMISRIVRVKVCFRKMTLGVGRQGDQVSELWHGRLHCFSWTKQEIKGVKVN